MKELFISLIVMTIVLMRPILSFGLDLNQNDHAIKKQKTLGVLTQESVQESEQKWRNSIQAEMQICENCTYRIISTLATASNSKQFSLDTLIHELPQLDILLLTWNESVQERNKELLNLLNEWSSKGLIVVLPVDQARPGEPIHSIAKTIAGQIGKALIIADLNSRDDLLERAFFGPQILTGLKRSEDNHQTGRAALKFAVGLLKNLDKKQKDTWVEFLKNRKMQSRRIWPSYEEMFR